MDEISSGEKDEASFSAATTLKRQPKFTKNFYNLNVSQPLNDNAALMFVYSRKESDIPFWHTILKKWEDQSRESETYMLRGAWDANERNQFSLSFMHSPHSASYVRSNIKDGDFTAEGGGYNANLKWDNQNKWGKVSTKVIWKQNENTIRNKGNNFYNWLKTDSIDWVSSFSGTTAQQGGYGTVRTEQSGINFKQDWQLNPVSVWGIQHQFDFGFDTDFSEARYQRKENTYTYATANRKYCDM